MRVLLDTHAFLWLDAAPDKLSTTAARVFQDPDNEIFLSIANIGEICRRCTAIPSIAC